MSALSNIKRISESFNHNEVLSDTDLSEDYDYDPMYTDVAGDFLDDE